MVYLLRGSCRSPPLPKILLLFAHGEIANLAPSVSFCLISAFLRLIRLSFSLTLPSALHYYLSACCCCRFGTYLVASDCTYGLCTVSFHSFSLLVSFDAVSIRYTYRLAPWLLYLLSDLNKCFRLLTGFARCTTLGVCGRWWIRTTGVPDIKMLSCGGLLFFAFVLSANLPNMSILNRSLF